MGDETEESFWPVRGPPDDTASLVVLIITVASGAVLAYRNPEQEESPS